MERDSLVTSSSPAKCAHGHRARTAVSRETGLSKVVAVGWDNPRSRQLRLRL